MHKYLSNEMWTEMKHTLCLACYISLSLSPFFYIEIIKREPVCYNFYSVCVCFLTYCVSTVIIVIVNTISVSEPPVLLLSSCGESLAVWQQDGYKSLVSYALCQAEVWYYVSVVGHAEYKQIESMNVSFVLFSVRWSVVTVALQSDAICRQLVVLWIFFYHQSDKIPQW